MIRLQFMAHVVEQKCTGCKLCVSICPSGAITVADKMARIDEDRCIDCQRCVDRCKKENAIERVPRPSEVVRYVEDAGVDPIRLQVVCEKAGILPDLPICGCSRTTGRETVAAILKGAKTPEDLCAATGLRSGCGIYCMTKIFQVFEACGIELNEPKDRRWISLTLSLADLTQDKVGHIDRIGPQYHMGEEWEKIRQRKPKSGRREGSHG